METPTNKTGDRPEPLVSLPGTRPGSLPEVQIPSPPGQKEIEIPENSASYLPPLPSQATRPAPKEQSRPPVSSHAPELVNRASSLIVILLTTGLAGFAVGVAVATCLLFGVFDVQPALIREVVGWFRGSSS